MKVVVIITNAENLSKKQIRILNVNNFKIPKEQLTKEDSTIISDSTMSDFFKITKLISLFNGKTKVDSEEKGSISLKIDLSKID